VGAASVAAGKVGVTGVATSTCCESTARDAAMWGYRTIMVTFGDVQTTDDLVTKLSG